MNDSSITIKRLELYESVWSTPMQRLAKNYNLSDRGLAKICARMEIPVPPRGWWRKLETGRKLAPPELPELTEMGVGEVLINIEHTKAVKKPKPMYEKIEIPDKLRKPHQLIKDTKEAFKPFKGDHWNQPAKPQALNISVYDGSLRRAYLIMDTLIKALEQRGLPVVNYSEYGKRKTAVEISGIKIEFRLMELFKQIKVPCEWSKELRTELEATGRFELRIEEYNRFGFRCSWKDGVKQRIEDCLGQFVATIEQWGPIQAKWEEERREKRRLEEIAQVERARKAREEQERVELLESELSNWRKAREIRKFIAEKEKVGAGDSEFLAWAKVFADTICPLTS